MSKVTYILGAGASYGERATPSSYLYSNTFLRGLPVVSELKVAIETQIHLLEGLDAKISLNNLGITQEEADILIKELKKLVEICTSYPTIDTYAKQLFVTKRNDMRMFNLNGENSYNTLKRLLSVAFILLQEESTRDLRYDGFIASLIDEKRQLPKMTILSWNYDAQFEMAYSGYYLTERYIPTLWKELNVLNKTYYTEYDGTKDFAIIKLNGTAFFTDEDSPKLDIGEYCEERMIDTYYGGSVRTKYKHAVAFLSYPQYHNTLSYAWEKSKKVDLEGSIKQRVVDTKDLIIIGYSFPYVNDKTDRVAISNMPLLERVYIQDPNFEEIKERIESMLPENHQVKFIPKKTNQFFIPNSFT